MSTSFQEFLKQKGDVPEVKERIRSRREWIDAVNRLLDQIRQWLREADPEELLEVSPYETQGFEERLGIYGAPSLRIQLGTDAVDVVPDGRFSTGPFMLRDWMAIPGNLRRIGGPPAGCVKITNGERKYWLFRSLAEGGQEHWYAVSERLETHPFDRARLEAILQDLLS